jgi:hypothetical protein
LDVAGFERRVAVEEPDCVLASIACEVAVMAAYAAAQRSIVSFSSGVVTIATLPLRFTFDPGMCDEPRGAATFPSSTADVVSGGQSHTGARRIAARRSSL